jgi:transposase
MSSTSSTCPDCSAPSHRIHGHSPRTRADLPWATAPIALRVIVRRCRCRPCSCRRQTCAERLPNVAPLYARTTTRCATTQAHTGLVLGGAAGARHLSRHGAPVRRNTLLRRVRSVSLPEGPAPASIGRDDWAWRTGQRSGTSIGALQRGGPVDFLAERAAATVATWLQSPPDGTIVARDRAAASAAGIRQGAPNATQVADRLHWLKHVAAALQEVFSGHHREIDQLHHVPHHEPPTPGDGSVTVPGASPVATPRAPQQIAHNRTRRGAAYAQAPALRQQGWTMQAMSPHRGRPHRTIKKDLAASTFPARPPRRRPPAILAPYKASRLERWHTGCHRARELWRARQARGGPGQYRLVADSVSRLRPAQGRLTTHRKAASPATIAAVDKPRTPRRATWWVRRHEATRNADAKEHLTQLHAQAGESAEASSLTQDFAARVRRRQPEHLETWRERATASGLQAFKRCATGLRADDDAVKAGVTLRWSNGPVEGQIHRRNMLKRQMDGRAGIGLLRQRVLQPT